MNHDSRSFEDDLSSLKADVAVIRSNYATKADLQELRTELSGEIHASRAASEGKTDALGIDLRAEIAGVRLEMEKLRVEMQKMRADVFQALHAQTWKMFGFGVVLVTAVHFVTRAGY
ncbi:MAG: hypothetical protein M3R60_00075 [Pseudomonadota bacterium]|jgi:hypothetical protein|nr:hypothetical protein [Pseudomonadota bacterium]